MSLSPEQAREVLWRKGILTYKLHSGQKKIYAGIQTAEDRKIFVLCSRRFGKSYLAALLALEMAIKKPKSKIIILAANKIQAKEIFNPIIDDLRSDAPEGFVKQLKAEHKWQVGESQLLLSGYDTIKNMLRGQGADLIIVDEAGIVNPETYQYVYQSVLSPILLHSQGKLIFLTTPPIVPLHPFWDNYVDSNTKFKYTIYDNPLLSSTQISEAIKDCGGELSSAFRREYMCEYVFDESLQVLPHFNPEMHVYDFTYMVPEYVKCWLTVDLGGIRDKTAIILSYFDYKLQKVVFHKSRHFNANTPLTLLVKDGILPYIEEAKALGCFETPIYIDAPGQVLVDLQHQHGISAVLPFKSEKDEAINAINVAFYNDKILVNPDCQELIRCFIASLFNSNRTDVQRTSEHGHSDLLFAAVYAYRMRNEHNPAPKVHHSPERTYVRAREDNDNLNLIPEIGKVKFNLNTSYGGRR